jgi:ferric-dicitrate binding protein FerR (iron transport regulator)
MSRNTFDRLLDKYLAGKCTAEEVRLVEQWYALLDGQELESQWNKEELKEKIWNKIQTATQPKAIRTKNVSLIWGVYKYAAAAAILLCMSMGIAFLIKNQNQDKASIPTIAELPYLIQKNTSDKNITLTMEEGSQITLLPEAEIMYPKQFAQDKREVELRGEAFFQITKNPTKPFLVHANGTVTKVLGTSFTIRAFEKEKMVTVTVKTGKVSVYSTRSQTDKYNNQNDPETQGVVLTPNQKAVFDMNTKNVQKTVTEKPALLIPLSNTQDFTFDDAPIADIFNALEKAYGIDIVYDEEVLKNCTLTTTLTDVPMFEKLKIICAAINGTFKEIDAQIVITAKGCS